MLSENYLQVLERPVLSPEVAPTAHNTPREIERKVNQLLEQQPHFRGRQFRLQCTCDDGNLYLSGKLPSYYFKQVAQEVVRRVEGAWNIFNEIVVTSPEGDIECDCSRLQPNFSSRATKPK